MLQHFSRQYLTHKGDEQPWQPDGGGFQNRPFSDFIIGNSSHPCEILTGLFLHDIQYIIDRNPADQPPLFVDHRGGDQVVFVK